MGLILTTPTIVEEDGFQSKVFLPPREHGPAHVHVSKAGEVAIVTLPHATQSLMVQSVSKKMRNANVVAAVRLVEAHVDMSWMHWRKYHA
jgi:hypothetical protein